MTPNPNPALEPQARRPVRKLPSAGGSLHIDSGGIAPAEPQASFVERAVTDTLALAAPLARLSSEGLGKPILDLADDLGSYFSTPAKMERPKHIGVMPQRLTRFPDCPLCALNVNDCQCDPDAYAVAVYARRSA